MLRNGEDERIERRLITTITADEVRKFTKHFKKHLYKTITNEILHISNIAYDI